MWWSGPCSHLGSSFVLETDWMLQSWQEGTASAALLFYKCVLLSTSTEIFPSVPFKSTAGNFKQGTDENN